MNQTKRLIIRIAIALCTVSHMVQAGAALVDNSDGTVTDTSSGLMWLKSANAGGPMDWASAKLWANNLDFAGHGDWRLPAITDSGVAGCGVSAFAGTDCGYNVDLNTGELARLWYGSLGNLAAWDTQGNFVEPTLRPINSGPFVGMQPNLYWSSTGYAPDTNYAWSFDANWGAQGAQLKSNPWLTWAVRSIASTPEVSAVPAPQTLLLFGIGIAAIWATRRIGIRKVLQPFGTRVNLAVCRRF